MPSKVDPTIEVYCSKLEERILAINTGGRNYSNLSVEEIKALRNLKNCRDIIIKEAGKGSAVVVWDRKDYCREAYRHKITILYTEVNLLSISRSHDFCSLSYIFRHVSSACVNFHAPRKAFWDALASVIYHIF